jgi:CRISPR/Cas system-associated exonuclease Cas4 (RecB family)
MITKTNYIQYLKCPRSLWLSKYRKDLKPTLSDSEQFRIDQGHEVEELSRCLFDQGALISALDLEEAEEQTKELLDGKGVIYQATVIYDGLAARADIIVFNEAEDGWDLYEVKSSSELKNEYLDDVTFQKYVFEESGYKIANVYVIYLNNEYLRRGDIDLVQLFVVENVNEQVKERSLSIVEQTNRAKQVLVEASYEDVECGCTLSSSDYPEQCFGELPEFSVHKLLSRSHKRKNELLDMGIVDVGDIPEVFPLSIKQELYARAYKTQETIIDKDAIKERLESLIYPLYFLDYETVSLAVPPFDGYKPYQQMVFQYSLHVLHEDGSLNHYEYVADSACEDPSKELLVSLSKAIDQAGTVIVWNESFEIGRNNEMAELYPEYESFIMSLVNNRVFDLMNIFFEQLYVDPRFNASYSIKKVLPVLVPELKYDDLEISEGMTASLSWYRYYFEGDKTIKNIQSNLKEYCKLDTLAMVEIYKVLRGL